MDRVVHAALSDSSDRTPASFKIERSETGHLARILGLTARSAFQPIVQVDGRGVVGHEAFLRVDTPPGMEIPPPVVFAVAASEGKVVSLDRVCRALHLLNYMALGPDDGFLFLNVDARHVANVHGHGRVFERLLKHQSFPPSRVVLEIQQGGAGDEVHLAEAVENYRKRGFAIAIGDFGKGHSNLDRLWRLEPDFVKLSGDFLVQAMARPRVRDSVAAMVEGLHRLRCKVVAEKVETEEAARTARDLGVDYLQGHHLGVPGPRPGIRPSPLFSKSLETSHV
jgi:EAL domain-containing protein (putative c-di-GMP-specific phosphodiesterase class I)